MLFCAPLLSAALALSAPSLHTPVPPLLPAPAWLRVGIESKVVFPTPGRSVLLDSSDEGMSYYELVEQFCESTGLPVILAKGLRSQLLDQQVEVLGPIEVPAEHVYRVVESLLADLGLMLEPLGSSGVFRLRLAQGGAGEAFFVTADELETYADHPALVVWTTIELPYVDARQLTNSLRNLMTDTHFQMAIPVGNTNAMILRGRAPQTAALCSALYELNERMEQAAVAQQAADEAARAQLAQQQAQENQNTQQTPGSSGSSGEEAAQGNK